jgi:hypothetical protein
MSVDTNLVVTVSIYQTNKHQEVTNKRFEYVTNKKQIKMDTQLTSDGSVNSKLSMVGMIDGTDLKAPVVPSNDPRLLPPISRRPVSHHGGLGEDAGTTVGVRPHGGVDGGKRNGVLIVLPEMEMSREPRLDTSMPSDQIDERLALFFVRMIQPATPVDYMIFPV